MSLACSRWIVQGRRARPTRAARRRDRGRLERIKHIFDVRSDGNCDEDVVVAVDHVRNRAYDHSSQQIPREKEDTLGKVEVSNDELRTVRDAMRELNRMVDLLESGDSEKFVLTKHGQMRAVVLSVEGFARLHAGTTAPSLASAA